MSSDSGKKFCAEYAKRGTAGCKKCKTKIEKGLLRIGKIVPNPFSDAGTDMKEWYHLDCIFEAFSKARATTKKIEDSDDIDGFTDLEKDDRKLILQKIDDLENAVKAKRAKQSPKAKTPKQAPKKSPQKVSPKAEPSSKDDSDDAEDDKNGDEPPESDPNHKDNSFKEFRKLCAKIFDESSYTGKTAIVREFLTRGTSGKFKGDTYMWLKFLLPMVNKRIYNLQNKQLCKVFSRVFGGAIYEEMVEDLEQGDIAETVATFHEQSEDCPPAKKANLNLHQIDRDLEKLSKLTREDDQVDALTRIAKKCTSNDLKMIVRLIKHDIRINAGPKHILEAINPAAYEAFQASLDLKEVVRQSKAEDFGSGTVTVGIKICTPVRPMLAEPCRSVEFAFKRCPKGMYTEVKYDGERVQLHKNGKEFLYFSRSLKPVVPHKVKHFKEFIPQAFPSGDSLIIDAEILVVNTETDEILPFGTLGVHKRAKFSGASVCLFVFDCLFYNGKSLLDEPLVKRREILSTHMKEVKHHVMLSTMEHVKNPSRLKTKIENAINEGLEGLVLKDPQSKYEPGKRHWMKVKKDYLENGSMADSADLVVLGAYFGTGNKGGLMSIFLMGCFSPSTKRWVTVTKVHTGHDDATLNRLQKELKMDKISKNTDLVPGWLDVKSQLVPDFVAKDPFKSQVWEITGAEFSKAEAHTANGISIRFPRVTRIRSDKDPKDATSLPELQNLFKTSKEQVLKLEEEIDDGDVDDMDENDEEEAATAATTVDDKKKKNEKSPSKNIKRPKTESSDEEEHNDDDDGDDNQKPSCSKQSPQAKKARISKEDEEGETANGDSPKQPKKLPPCDLVNVFSGVVIESFPKDFEHYDDLVRYFVAYDGKISRKNTTHRIGSHKGTIKVEWVWESIKRRRKLDETPFKNR